MVKLLKYQKICNLSIMFNIYGISIYFIANSKSNKNSKSDELKKYDLILEAMKSMSSKIEKAIKDKS